MRERTRLAEAVERQRRLEQELEDQIGLAELAEEEDDAETSAEAEAALARLKEQLDRLQLESLLSGEADANDCFLEIHAGAGGTESQDWAEMLLRMYLRFAERRGWSTDMVEYQAGEEAGIKSATVMVRGDYAYGYLKAERGVHRLVRISPFDAAKRRHTSFASVYVYPEIDEDIEVEINDKDLRVDTYRSSGAGGQHVNVTDSAIRITHIPTNTVVTVQNERSQLQNRAVAMKILAARLAELARREKQNELDQLRGEQMEIGFGSQIRSYVLHPYQMVKDHRTLVEVGNVQAALDGELDRFIQAELRRRAQES